MTVLLLWGGDQRRARSEMAFSRVPFQRLPSMPALLGFTACTRINGLGTFEVKYMPVESVRLNGTFCDDKCACLGLNGTESADTVLH